MKKILLTGGTHVGKTTILENIEKKGYTRCLSVAGENIDLLRKLLGDGNYQEWRKQNFLEFQKMNLLSDLHLYYQSESLQNAKENIIFYDRGIFDWIASLKRENILVPEYLEVLITNIQYDIVCIVDPIEIHDMRQATGRMLDKEKSLKWAQFIEAEYTERGHRVIHVPNFKCDTLEESVNKRCEFLLKYII